MSSDTKKETFTYSEEQEQLEVNTNLALDK